MRKKLLIGFIAIVLIGGLGGVLFAACLRGEEGSNDSRLTGQDLIVNDENPWVSRVRG